MTRNRYPIQRGNKNKNGSGQRWERTLVGGGMAELLQRLDPDLETLLRAKPPDARRSILYDFPITSTARVTAV